MVRAQRRRGAGRCAAPRRRGTAGGRGCTTGCPGLVSLKPPASPAGAGPRCRGHGEGDPGSGRRAEPGPAAVRAPGHSRTRLLTGPGSWRGPWQAPLGRSLRASAGVRHSTNVPVTEDTGGLGPPDPLGEGFCMPGSRTYTPTTHTTHQTHNTYNTHTRKLQDLLKTFSTKAGENFLKKSNASRGL